MIWNGLIVTGLGLGWVFMFITIMVLVISLVGFISKRFPEKQEIPPVVLQTQRQPKDAEKIAAVLAAVHHRSKK